MAESGTIRVGQRQHRERPRPVRVPGGIKLRHLNVRDFKALSSLELDFPAPRMPGDPDVFVLGSKNGLGKTSVLESCALLMLSGAAPSETLELARFMRWPINIWDLLVRAGAKEAVIKGIFDASGVAGQLGLTISRRGQFRVHGDREAFRGGFGRELLESPEVAERVLLSLAGIIAEPLLIPPLMYFHSYRKVQEGNPELGMMVDSRTGFRRTRRVMAAPGLHMEFPISAFKLEILRSMMGRASLFEELGDQDAATELQQLNTLLERYVGGTIRKLRPSRDNTIEFRIQPQEGPSFSFDGLSTGQKEIISTLYLIWAYTRERPGVILIDEPELHLNAEWHRDFLHDVHELAPANQYIVATHAQAVFESVEPSRRALLQEAQRVAV